MSPRTRYAFCSNRPVTNSLVVLPNADQFVWIGSQCGPFIGVSEKSRCSEALLRTDDRCAAHETLVEMCGMQTKLGFATQRDSMTAGCAVCPPRQSGWSAVTELWDTWNNLLNLGSGASNSICTSIDELSARQNSLGGKYALRRGQRYTRSIKLWGVTERW